MTIRSIGPHKVRHGDATTPGAIDELVGGRKIPILYTDPPWGDAHIKYFATLNKKQTGQDVEPTSMDSLLAAIGEAARKHVSHYLVVEYGLRWRDAVQAFGVDAGFRPRGVFPTFYGSKPKSKGGGRYPMDLHLFTRTDAEPVPSGWAEGVTGTHGYETVRAALAPLADACREMDGAPSPCVMDVCCGFGTTARAATELGLTFLGNELNATRMAKTVLRLKQESK